jgi:hypothetical protein
MVTTAGEAVLLTAENCAVVAPDETATDDGTANAALLLLNVIEVADAAAALSATVHKLLPGPVTEVGLHVKELKTGVAGA